MKFSSDLQNQSNNADCGFLILGIESSCDDTSLALLKDGRKIIHQVTASQIKEHAKFGGVVPEIAARLHERSILNLFHELLEKAGITPQELDAIAVTQGPGLMGSLLVGICFAKGLAHSLGIPLIPVNHVHAHVHGALLSVPEELDVVAELFPCLSLVVSGGHTHLYYMEHPTSFQLLGYTKDDACGECFDKVAKLLNLPYPGGPQIEALAKLGDPAAVPMPQMMPDKKSLEFSYSGLKTHVFYLLRNQTLDHAKIADICAGFQREALRQIVAKVAIAIERFPLAKSIVVAGGVSANQTFKDMMKAQNFKQKQIFPAPSLCSDNGAMIAALGYCEILGENAAVNVLHKQQEWDAYSRYDYQSK